MMSNAKIHMTNFFFNILNISMHPYLKLYYDFLGLKSLSDNLGFLRGSQTLTSSSGHQQDIRRCKVRCRRSGFDLELNFMFSERRPCLFFSCT